VKTLESLFAFLFPTTMILSESHMKKYLKDEKETFKTIMRITLPLVALIYIVHYHLLDLPLKLEPLDLWFNYRVGIATLCMAGYLYYTFFPENKFIPNKLFGTIIGFTLCFLQTKTITWYSEVPYIYSFLFMIITSTSLRQTPSQCLLYITVVFYIQVGTYKSADLNMTMVHSAFIVTLFFGTILSSLRYFQIKFFNASESLLEQQRENIEQNLEFAKTLKSFLPKKIVLQLEDTISSNNRITIHQAVDEILSPQRKYIACLACDIRGYTEQTKNNPTYIEKSVIPLTKNESSIVEKHQGVPRKIGDLLFSYYDGDNLMENTTNATLSAIAISLQEASHNNSLSEINIHVRKQIILAVGEAIVGNIGNADSAIEITAMGTPVNFLNRLESLVKSDEYISLIPRDHIIVSEETKLILDHLESNVEFKKYLISDHNIQIRDFEEVKVFYSFRATHSTYKEINEQLATTYVEKRFAS